jgi:hypothetical protein
MGFDGPKRPPRDDVNLEARAARRYELPFILGFLDECDLVKFARFTPSDEDCTRVLDQAEHIVRVTVPPQLDAPAPTARVPAPAGGGA